MEYFFMGRFLVLKRLLFLKSPVYGGLGGSMTPKRMRGTTPEIIAAARRLRQNLTPAEQVLWQALRNRQLRGLRFRCQQAVETFIVNFYCPEHRLVIKVDGEIHDTQQDYDAARTEKLSQQGYRVIRFSNQQVLTDLNGVLETILAE
jgi:very-short-patch-repair endonuclease